MKTTLSKALSNIDLKYIDEAANYTDNSKNIIKFFFKTPLAVAIITILLLTTTVAAGISLYNNPSSITFHDGTTVNISENVPYRKIPETALKTTEEKIEMTHSEIEESIGTRMLNHDNAYEDAVYYSTYLNNDGSIAVVDLWWADFLKINENKYANMSVSILNENADEGYVIPFIEGKSAIGYKTYQETYNITSLKTDAIIYFPSDMPERVSAEFVFDNALYRVTFFNFNDNEIKTILEELN